MKNRVPGQVDVLREAAPQMRRFRGGRVPVTDCIGVRPPVSVLAVPVLALMTPLALAARYVMLDDDEIALFETLAARELAACFRDVTDIFVNHYHRLARRRRLVELHGRAANTGDLHFHQR